MSLPQISPSATKLLLEKGALLIDIRDGDEHAREHIPQSRSVPLAKLNESNIGSGNAPIIFHCKTGNRTGVNAAMLAQAAGTGAFILEGGIEAWKKAGLAVSRDRKQPIEMLRQVQIVAGAMALLGAVLGYAVHPGFYALSGAVGAGLMFAGITGTCAMAHVLKRMPWNRIAAA